MKCSQYEILISAYVDKSLGPQEEQKLLSHLETCQECKATYEALKNIVADLKQIEEVPLPTDFHTNLMGRMYLEEYKTKASWAKKYWKWQYTGALVASLLIGGIFIGQLQQIDIQSDDLNVQKGDKVVRKYKDIQGNNPLRNSNLEQEDPIAFQLAEQEDRIDDVLTPMCAEVVVKDRVAFEEAFDTFLLDEQITYDKIAQGYHIVIEDETKGIVKWLGENCKEIHWNQEVDDILEGQVIEIKICMEP